MNESSLPTWMTTAQDVGLIGPASLRFHHDHALGFAADESVADRLRAGASMIDLGSGGGLPGLVLAQAFPRAVITLLDARLRSVTHLRQAVADEGLHPRVTVAHGRAEEFARAVEHREGFDLATARGFASPGVCAELASGFLAEGGLLAVSEPPETEDRWPTEALAAFSLEPVSSWETPEGHYRSFRKTGPTPDRVPRRTGVPGKRPAF